MKRRVFLHPGEYFFAKSPAEIRTILGSCVAFTMYDPQSRHGAMCHCLLPSHPPEMNAAAGRNANCFRYVDSALQAMLEQFAAQGVAANRLQIKLFGGANVLVTQSAGAAIGSLNWQRAKQLLTEFNLSTSAHDIGGVAGRVVIFDTEMGEVRVRRFADRFEGGRRAFLGKALWQKSAVS